MLKASVLALRFLPFAVCAGSLILSASFASAQHPGSFPKGGFTTGTPQNAAPAVQNGSQPGIQTGSPGDRSAALAALFAEVWQDELEHNPQFATSTGDKRYNDRLDDYSAAAYNDEVARGAGYLTRLALIPTDGLPEGDLLSKDLLLRRLVEQQQEAVYKPWEMPVNQFAGIQVDLPQLVSIAPFATVKDTTTTSPACTPCPGRFSR